MHWLIHDYREHDLAEVVHLIDSTAELGQESVFSLAECISALTSRQPAVVAVHQGVPIGAALACVAGERGWVMRIAISAAWRGRGLASALLVELERRLIAARVSRLAAALRSAFARIAELERVLVFIDEVEEIAPVRGEAAQPGGLHGVTNELLKLIPGFRERDERLLVCATNSVRSLDPAFLRPGRFDYLIPIGTPDAAARSAIWSRYTDGRAEVDVSALMAASELFTPADIEHAARVAAQASFERDLEAVGAGAGAPGRLGASTEDYLAAIAQCRPTVTPEMVDEFSADITAHARC
ncbi:bifunctional GNAT family N-acetyltransferase/ATP-binding protein [Streptomyces angustmyceticus]|uniref:N-acetyltransferase domain-containing protein n=1 Tax=Streptomyces angustmyceticus TaxID=285578 RepID=A0A5J4LJ51_9ACTN|nr:bifunctional GNAT family N-acetyltransferase/ATP-binding protein [Streptomyces angustmyceticus]UAL71030.1 GNAT family N-acetyltransferase [Streptomyces angustmyceticus]GES32524.1 hypothetical protein San01_50110 [Streptomyces angustmyceticus]